MTPGAMVAVIEAFACGEVVEFSYKSDPNNWRVCKMPLWNFNHVNYRVRREEKA